jgi:hypothetical protein
MQRWHKTTKETAMKTSRHELTLRSALSDPLIRALMTADKVDPVQLESMLTWIARQVTPKAANETGAGCPCAA